MIKDCHSPRFLILGGGAVVSEYYIPALYRLGYADRATVVDSSPLSLEMLRKKYSRLTIQQTDFRNFLDNLSDQDKFDASLIALPNSFHEEAVIKSLDCGLHTLCEKPLSLTRSACFQMTEKAETANRILTVGMVRQLLPSVSALREALAQRLIGEIVSIDIEDGRPYTWMSDSGAPFQPENGGVLTDIGIHYLDLVKHLIEKLIPLKYRDDRAGGVEANAQFHLKTESGIPVRLALSRTHNLRNTAIFRGKRGELILEKDTFDVCLWRPYNSKLFARLHSTKPFVDDNWPLTLESCFNEEFFRFARSISGIPTDYVTAREAASTIGLIEWAYNQRVPRKDTLTHIPSRTRNRFPVPDGKKLVVTGGTGFIGTHLVRRLHELGFDKITVPVRNYRTCAHVARFPVTMPHVNLLDYNAVKENLKNTRYVFHLAYGKDGTYTHRSRVTIKGTQNVVRAAIEAGVESVVVLSTMYVFGHANTKASVDETWPYAPIGGEYGESKAKMEKWCLKRGRSSKHTRIIILNPSCVYGPGGKAYTKMPVQMAKNGLFCWIEDGRGIANYTFIENLLDAILLAAACKEAHGQRFIITDGVTSWRDFLTPLLGQYRDQIPSYTEKELQTLQRQIRPGLMDVFQRVISDQEIINMLVETALFHKLLWVARKWMPGLLHGIRKLKETPTSQPILENKNRPTPPTWLGDLFSPTPTVFSSGKAERILGWKPRIGLEEGQKITVAWLHSKIGN